MSNSTSRSSAPSKGLNKLSCEFLWSVDWGISKVLKKERIKHSFFHYSFYEDKFWPFLLIF